MSTVCHTVFLEIYRTAKVISNPYYSLMVEFLSLVCDKPIATNHNAVCCDLCDKWFIYTVTISAKTHTKS